jgi:uncharacterized protein YjbJ (UPF0337 family)
VISKRKAQGPAKQLYGRIGLALSQAAGSREMHDRGDFDEANGQTQEAVAHARSKVNQVVGKAMEKQARR